MKVALVYDWVNKIGGAERILNTLHEIWPEAPLYTSVYNTETAPWADDFRVIPSFLQNFPWAKTRHESYPYLMPLAFESFNFDDYDIVISVTSAEAKGIITRPKTLHICYSLTPTRYLWSHFKEYFRGDFLRFISAPAISYLRFWDKIAAQRPDYYLAISENVKDRIKKYYGRDSEVIYPPAAISAGPAARTSSLSLRALDGGPPLASPAISIPYTLSSRPFFLIVSRLVPYKRIDIAIEAFNKLKLPLKIIGSGSEEKKLKNLAKPNIEFLKELTDEELLRYYQGCQALIFPQEEDLGLTSIEAQACGRPVIAFRGGGALETIIEGKTGEFFYPQTSKALREVVSQFNGAKYQASDCRKNAQRFDREFFKEKFRTKVEDLFLYHGTNT